MGLFLRSHDRFKNGKHHIYWSLVENKRCAQGKVIQRQVLYLGEVTQAQREALLRTAQQVDPPAPSTPRLPLFGPSETASGGKAGEFAQVKLSEFSLHQPRQWGACWVASQLWQHLQLDQFWTPRLPPSREGTHWRHVLQTLVTYRLIEPGSEWRLHRHWFAQSAMRDLLGEDFSLAAKDNLYRCLDKLLAHRPSLFGHLQERWRDLFGAKFEVLLYDLTSTYFESDPPFPEPDKRRYGYSRDKRSDCVQVVIGLIVTPEGFPLAYEVLPGNTSDRTTLKKFLKLIRKQYGKAERIWVMDRGVPTEEVLELMQRPRHKLFYLVGTPKGRLSKLERQLLKLPWESARPAVQVKLLPRNQELYVLVRSQDRVHKERSMRRRRLKALWRRLKELRGQKRLKRDELILKVGQEKQKAGRAVFNLVKIHFPEKDQPVNEQTFTFELMKQKLRQTIRREGQYLLRTNMTGRDPKELWQYYLQLVEIEAAFKNLKDDLELRPVFHQLEHRIEAHIFVAFMAYCLQITLKGCLRRIAPGLTPRAVLEKFATMQLIDVHFPTTDHRTLVFTRYTQPEKDHKILLMQLGWELPPQPPPRISAQGTLET
jgi:transposase